VRTICALAVICLYFMNFTPWRATSNHVYRLGDSSDILSYVNMFIGTKNGGRVFAPMKWQFADSSRLGHAFTGASLPYGRRIC
jgi:hypothetical protein